MLEACASAVLEKQAGVACRVNAGSSYCRVERRDYARDRAGLRMQIDKRCLDMRMTEETHDGE